MGAHSSAAVSDLSWEYARFSNFAPARGVACAPRGEVVLKRDAGKVQAPPGRMKNRLNSLSSIYGPSLSGDQPKVVAKIQSLPSLSSTRPPFTAQREARSI